MKARVLFSVPVLAASLQAYAACPVPPVSALPIVPDGSTASAETMIEAQERVERYVATIETYLACKQNRISDFVHNGLVHRAENIADEYNAELREFRIKEGELASF